MKRITFFALLLLACASCTKSNKHSLTQQVVFEFRMVEEQPMTRAVDNDAIADWIETALPEKLSLRLTDANGVRYNIETGTSVELPIGIYTVTGKNAPTASANIASNDVFFSTSRPTIAVNTSIEITYTQKNYVIPATYGAFGIVVDYTETANATYESSHGETGNIEFAQVGTSGIAFVNGTLGTFTLNVTLTPANANDYEQTTYTFQTAYNANSVSPTNGNYYIIHPKGKSSVDGGSFTYSIAGFRAVDVN
jgi:hypothetical protein